MKAPVYCVPIWYILKVYNKYSDNFMRNLKIGPRE